MKVGIDARVLMDKNYSGVAEYTFNLTSEILKKNYQKGNPYKFVLFYNSAHNLKGHLPEFKEYNPEIKYTRYPNKIFNYLLQKGLNRPRLDQLLGVDIFLFPHINFFSLSSGAKSALTIHDLSFLRYPEFFSLKKNIWHLFLDLPRMVKKVDKIITISENTRKDIEEILKVDKEKIKVIPGGINKKEFKLIEKDNPSLKKVKEKYNLNNKFILYLGNLEPRKNVEGTIRAFDNFKTRYPKSEYKLAIAGARGWKGKNILKAWRNSVNKKDIKFLRYINKEDKIYLYNLASLFLFPSYYEGFGLPPLEAMACGTPVITSFNSSLPEVVKEAALTINPHDYNQIFKGMEKILFDKNLQKQLIVSGFERVDYLSDHNPGDLYWETINDLLQE